MRSPPRIKRGPMANRGPSNLYTPAQMMQVRLFIYFKACSHMYIFQGGGPMYSHPSTSSMTMIGQQPMTGPPQPAMQQQQQQSSQNRVPTIAVQQVILFIKARVTSSVFQPSLPAGSQPPQLYTTPGGATRVNGVNGGAPYANGPGSSAPPNSQRALPSRPDVHGFDDYDEEDFQRNYHY